MLPKIERSILNDYSEKVLGRLSATSRAGSDRRTGQFELCISAYVEGEQSNCSSKWRVKVSGVPKPTR